MRLRLILPILVIVFLLSVQAAIAVDDSATAATGRTGLLLSTTDRISAVAPVSMLELGTTYEGSLSQPNEWDSYYVALQEGDVFYIRINSTWRLWPFITIYNPDTTKLDDCGTGSYTNELTVTAPMNGTYRVEIGDWDRNDVGNYTFYVQRLNNPGHATPLQQGEVVASNIVQYTEFDTYTFHASANDQFLFRMRSSWYRHPHIHVYQPNGTKVGEMGTLPGWWELTVQAPTTGTYTVLVGDWDGLDLGDYWVYSQCLNNPIGGHILSPMQTVTGSIETFTEFDSYTITPVAGTDVTLTMTSSWAKWPYFYVYFPNGTLLDDSGTLPDSISLTFRAPVAGTYKVLAGDWDCNSTGTYSLYASFQAPPPVEAAFMPIKLPCANCRIYSFFDQSTGNPTSRFWDFGDGVTSTEPNPTHNYLANGQYNVTLTVSNGITSDTAFVLLNVSTVYDPLPLPGGFGPPTDQDGDGKYEDVNGNRRADFADVVLYFNSIDWIGGFEPIWPFDYNENGRIDFADVVWLFNNL